MYVESIKLLYNVSLINNEQTCSLQITDSVSQMEIETRDPFATYQSTNQPARQEAGRRQPARSQDSLSKNWRRAGNSPSQLTRYIIIREFSKGRAHFGIDQRELADFAQQLHSLVTWVLNLRDFSLAGKTLSNSLYFCTEELRGGQFSPIGEKCVIMYSSPSGF